jgi:septum formation protein
MDTIFNTRWRLPGKQIILASQSPRRKEILALLGIEFDVINPAVENEQEFFKNAGVVQSIQRLATAKAETVSRHRPDSLVLGADTVVVVDNMILGKPGNADKAKEMLLLLSGKKHSVYTGVALVCGKDGFGISAACETSVYFREISEWEINDYCRGTEWQDKAGSYAIQGHAMAFIDKINGCYYNVVGLPVRKTIDCFTRYMLRKDQPHA